MTNRSPRPAYADLFLIVALSGATLCGSPVLAQFTTVINLDDASDISPTDIGPDTQVNVTGDGMLFGEFLSHNVGPADGSGENTEVNLEGGFFGGAAVNFFAGSTTNLSGGVYQAFSSVFHNGATLRVSGGRVEAFASATTFEAGSTLEVVGSSFFNGADRLPGLDQPSDEVTLDTALIRSLGAILSDGRRFALSPTIDPLSTVRLRAVSPPPSIGGPNLRSSTGPIPPYLVEGQNLTLDDGSDVPKDFLAGPGSRVVISAGNTATPTLRSVFSVAAEIVVTGVGRATLNAGSGSTVRVTEQGFLESFSTVEGESELIVTGGRVDLVSLSGSSRATVSGGTLGGAPTLGDERRGGVRLFDDSELHLIGTEFLLDGQPVDGLSAPGDSLVLPELEGRLTGTLVDGETFVFNLDASFSGENRSSFSPESTIRLTLVPEPSSGALLAGLLATAVARRRSARRLLL